MSNSDKGIEPVVNRRKKQRFVISPNFPVKVVLGLPDEADETWKDWPAMLVDISATGAHVQLSLAAVTSPESRCRLKLSLGTFKLEIPGTVAHFVCSTRLAIGGVRFGFPDQGVERAYHRVLEPAIIGASLAAAPASQEYSVRYKEEYTGKLSSRLTVWRENRGAEVSGFEFRMNHYVVGADRKPGGDPSAALAPKFKLAVVDEISGGGSQEPLPEAQVQEARWLFRLAAANLPSSVPVDVHKLLLSLV